VAREGAWSAGPYSKVEGGGRDIFLACASFWIVATSLKMKVDLMRNSPEDGEVVRRRGLRAVEGQEMPHASNFLLGHLAPAMLARLAPHLSVVELTGGEVLAEPHEHIQRVYFPHSGIISCIVELADGSTIETGMIGNDGVFGACHALDDKVSLNLVTTQIAGKASAILPERLRSLANELPDFRALLIKYEQFFLAQVQQTAACNAVHDIEARTCKWLSRMHDLVGPDLLLTQEFFARMMGVRRTSVTTVAGALQGAGLISYSRGRLHIIDIEQIRKRACECDHAVRSNFRLMFAGVETRTQKDQCLQCEPLSESRRCTARREVIEPPQ
jgi:CRP-like cAMP-binding protein